MFTVPYLFSGKRPLAVDQSGPAGLPTSSASGRLQIDILGTYLERGRTKYLRAAYKTRSMCPGVPDSTKRRGQACQDLLRWLLERAGLSGAIWSPSCGGAARGIYEPSTSSRSVRGTNVLTMSTTCGSI